MISIIIPNFNRATLIGETLESIIAQTYKNWECIIVDDGSTDNSLKVIQDYINNDCRFRFFQRPAFHPKGANACRNIGMDMSLGDYIIFFDSDDLMLENHIEKKLELIQSGDFDYIITKSEYFNNPRNINPINYRDIENLPITADNFITKKINWLTLDPIIKRNIAKQITFTEKSNSAEEYNYFVKLTLKTENAIFSNLILTKRRFHDASYQVNLKTKKEVLFNQFYYYYDTYSEIYQSNISTTSKQFLLSKISELLFAQNFHCNKLFLYTQFIKEFGFLKGLNKIKILELKNIRR
jgi:glycosyltransferase involved in cell wall biosynthesis